MDHAERTAGRAALARVLVAALVAAAAALVPAGCGRQHLSRDFGVDVRQAWRLQQVPPPVQATDLLPVLDGASAEQIWQNYHRSLATADTGAELGEAPAFDAGE